MANARERGWSWQQIAEVLGVSKQAVHKKHGGAPADREEGLMFERFTKPARAVVARAHEESAALGGDRIARGAPPHRARRGRARRRGRGTSSTALGLTADVLRADVRATGGLDADALASIGIDLDAVRRRVEESFGPGALGTPPRRPAATVLARPRRRRSSSRCARRSPGATATSARSTSCSASCATRATASAPLLRRRGRTPETVRAALLEALRKAA